MTRIPDDAKHWDSGDWIDWHRTAVGVDDRPCAAATADPAARLTALHVSLLRAAKVYYEMTGLHLPIYDAIARVYAALHFDIPLEGPQNDSTPAELEVVHIAPHGPGNTVTVDMSRPFKAVLVVRIGDNFNTEARIIARKALPQRDSGTHSLSWQSLPRMS